MAETDMQEAGAGNLKWYVLKVQTNRESSIRANIQRRIARAGAEAQFGRIVIPTEKVVETKNGKKRIREQKLFPGYLIIEMDLNDDTWYLVRDTSGVGDFTGPMGEPQSMPNEDVERLLGSQSTSAEEPARIKIDMTVGDRVKIRSGAFESFDGNIESVDSASGKVTVLIEIFGRTTPVELDHNEVERQ